MIAQPAILRCQAPFNHPKEKEWEGKLLKYLKCIVKVDIPVNLATYQYNIIARQANAKLSSFYTH